MPPPTTNLHPTPRSTLGEEKIRRGEAFLEMLRFGWLLGFLSFHYPRTRIWGGGALPGCPCPGFQKEENLIFGELHHKCTSSRADDIAVMLGQRGQRVRENTPKVPEREIEKFLVPRKCSLSEGHSVFCLFVFSVLIFY